MKYKCVCVLLKSLEWPLIFSSKKVQCESYKPVLTAPTSKRECHKSLQKNKKRRRKDGMQPSQ
uniref:Uncharacterized protein n=1 Tax=Rhizophora mucronata TaxID=61149 RepID=A0A2P2NMP8_RHIMU